MGKDQTKASDHPTTDALANQDSNGVATGDVVDTGGAYIGFSATNIKLDPAPEMDDVFVVMVKVECNGDGNKKMADGEIRPKRSLKVLSAWRPGAVPAGQDPSQPGLYEIDPVNGAPKTGDSGSEHAAEVDEEADEDDDDSVDTGSGSGVTNPAFSAKDES